MQEQVEWKMKWLGKGEDPAKVVEEFKRLSNEGLLTPEKIVEEARDSNSILHKFFEWDNDVAAEQYRLQQARTLINNVSIKVIHNGEPVNVGAYEIVSVADERQYKIVTVMTDDDIEQVKIRTMDDLRILKDKLKFYSQFKSVAEGIETVISCLKNTKTK